MARKNTVVYKVKSAQSLASGFTTNPTFINYLDNIAYQINVTTTNSTGTFVVQGSIDYAISEPGGAVTNAGNWCDLPLGGGTPTVAAANDVILIDMNQLPYVAVRVKYTSTVAGTGICDIYILAKQLGG